MTNRTALKNAYRRFASNQRVSPEELGRPVEDVVQLSRRMSRAAWFNDATRELRTAIAAPDVWARRSYVYSAKSCLGYAQRMRADA